MPESGSERRSPELCRPVLVGARVFGCPIAAQVSVAADVQRGEEAEQQDQGERYGVRMPARSMDADAAQCEADCERE